MALMKTMIQRAPLTLFTVSIAVASLFSAVGLAFAPHPAVFLLLGAGISYTPAALAW